MFTVRGTQHAVILLFGLISVAGAPAQAQDADAIANDAVVSDDGAMAWPVVPDPNVDPVVFAVNQRLGEGSVTKGHHPDDVAVLTEFYKGRTDGTVWVGDEGYTAKARAAKSELSEADNWGLESKHYKLPAALTTDATPDQKAEAEIGFGLTVLKYARHARQGRVRPESVTRINDFPGLNKDDVAEMWRALANADNVSSALRNLHPQYPQFKRLRQALLEARGVSDITTGALPTQKRDEPAKGARIDLPSGEDLTVGMQHKDIALLRDRLGVKADVGSNAYYFDAPLAAELKAFQSEVGLVATGNLDAATRKRLNAALLEAEAGATETADASDDESSTGKKKNSRKIQLILNNMERWRWLPDDLGELYVWNNVPEFRTRVFKGEKRVFSEKIIVGLPEWATPSFMADMKYIIFHPSWGVPRGIKLKELLPRLKRAQPQSIFDFFGGGGGGTTAVLKAYDLTVYKNGQQVNPSGINWNSSNILNYSFVQPPGKKNPLGIVKFRFPNKHNVYMHDTIERELFAKSRRAYSHGCIRVRDPIKFAEILLTHDQGMDASTVRRRARSGGSVTLDKHIPVYVTYMTARVDEKGKLHTYGDVYGRDGRLASQLGRSMRFEQPKVAKPKTTTTRTRSASKKKKKKKKSASSGSTFPSSMSQAISGRYN